MLKALGFTSDTLIYIASGEIYGGEARMASLRAQFPKIVRLLFLCNQWIMLCPVPYIPEIQFYFSCILSLTNLVSYVLKRAIEHQKCYGRKMVKPVVKTNRDTTPASSYQSFRLASYLI